MMEIYKNAQKLLIDLYLRQTQNEHIEGKMNVDDLEDEELNEDALNELMQELEKKKETKASLREKNESVNSDLDEMEILIQRMKQFIDECDEKLQSAQRPISKKSEFEIKVWKLFVSKHRKISDFTASIQSFIQHAMEPCLKAWKQEQNE